MKKTVIVSLILSAVLFVVGIALCICAFQQSDFSPQEFFSKNLSELSGMFSLSLQDDFKKWNNDVNENGTYSVTAEEVDSIDISWISGSVTLNPYDGELITFSEPAGSSLPLGYGLKNGTLFIQFSKHFTFFSRKKDLVVNVPYSFAESINELDIDIVSADLNLSDVFVNDMQIESVSGKIVCNRVSADKTDMQSVSGGVAVQGTFENIDVETVSGDVVITSTICPDMVDTESVSGDVALYIPEDSAFTATLESLSGDFTTSFATKSNDGAYKCGDGGGIIKSESVSGDLIIRYEE